MQNMDSGLDWTLWRRLCQKCYFFLLYILMYKLASNLLYIVSIAISSTYYIYGYIMHILLYISCILCISCAYHVHTIYIMYILYISCTYYMYMCTYYISCPYKAPFVPKVLFFPFIYTSMLMYILVTYYI